MSYIVYISMFYSKICLKRTFYVIVCMVIYMTKKERQQAILSLLQERGELHVQTICRIFHIVPMTVRRDLMELEQQGSIIRTHGGAIAKEKKTFDTETPLLKRRKINITEKQFIAEKAKKFIDKEDAIFIGSGSTMDLFSQSLLYYLPLTIVTDAINVAYTLYQDSRLHIYVLGGELRSNSLTLTGPLTQSALRHFQLKKAFFSVNAIDEQGKLYTSSIVESDLLQNLFTIVEDVYILCDSKKLGMKDFISIEHNRHYTLITDNHADPALLDTYRQLGINVI